MHIQVQPIHEQAPSHGKGQCCFFMPQVIMQLVSRVLPGAHDSCQIEYCEGGCIAAGNDGSCPCFRQRRAEVKKAVRSYIARGKKLKKPVYTTCWRSGNSLEARRKTVPGLHLAFIHDGSVRISSHWSWDPDLWGIIVHRSVRACAQSARQAKSNGHLPLIRTQPLTKANIHEPPSYR